MSGPRAFLQVLIVVLIVVVTVLGLVMLIVNTITDFLKVLFGAILGV